MAVWYPGISERVFEFGFNAEFCSKNSAILAGCPYIPTQNQEKKLGYDVKMKIAKGSKVRPLYLQHKVSRYVDKCAISNKAFFMAAGGPYFAFALDKDQYNLIHMASQKPSREFYYCAPIFTTRLDMNRHYMAHDVINHSVWIDISGCGAITDNKPHCIVYDMLGGRAFRFSNNPKMAMITRPEERGDIQLPWKKFGTDFLQENYIGLFNTLKDWWPERMKGKRKSRAEEKNAMPRKFPLQREIKDVGSGIEAIRDIASNYYGVSWLIEVE